jgi:hypothetical protein
MNAFGKFLTIAVATLTIMGGCAPGDANEDGDGDNLDADQSGVGNEDVPYTGSTFGKVWSEVASTPYADLTHETIEVSDFFRAGRNILRDAALRTVDKRHDLLPRFDKLLHPNGICLRGTWNITESSPYTGYFEQGRRGLLIARASVALSDTTRGTYRGFGLAGKLYPTEDPAHTEPLQTANFFAIDDLGGTKTDHFLDAPLTNEPKLSVRPETIKIAAIIPFIIAAFNAADTKPLHRPVYPIAELGMADPSQAHTPQYMMVQGAPGQRVDAADFRDELHVADYGGAIQLDISVAADTAKIWQKIGFIEFTEEIASDSCDHRLHFSHPKQR